MLKTGPAKTKTTKGSFEILIDIFIFIFLDQWQSFGNDDTHYNLHVSFLKRVLPIFVRPVLARGAGSNPATNDQ
jgi:hypothetical protein